jgi:hypothetical protein
METLVSVTTAREGEVSGGKLLLARGTHELRAGRPQEAIRTLGRALGLLYKHASRPVVRSGRLTWYAGRSPVKRSTRFSVGSHGTQTFQALRFRGRKRGPSRTPKCLARRSDFCPGWAAVLAGDAGPNALGPNGFGRAEERDDRPPKGGFRAPSIDAGLGPGLAMSPPRTVEEAGMVVVSRPQSALRRIFLSAANPFSRWSPLSGGGPDMTIAGNQSGASSGHVRAGSAAPQKPDRLTLVYDGQSGLGAMLLDVLKKAVGREECPLCEITYSPVGTRKAWRDCKARLGMVVDELHRDQLPDAWNISRSELPCILARVGEELPRILVSRDEIISCRGSVDALERKLLASLSSAARVAR